MQPRVLAAFDFGEPALEAVRQARELAHGVGGTLGLVHVLPATPDLRAGLLQGSWGLVMDEHAGVDAARAEMEAALRTRLGLEPGTLFIEHGAPYAEIVRRAETWNADYLVVGSHGRSGLPRVVFGSVAERVVRHAHCSVLVARPPSQKRGPVLVATDLSPLSLPAVAAGAAAARRAGAELVVMSVLEWSGMDSAAWAGMFGALPVLPSEQVREQLRDGARVIIEQALNAAGARAEVLLVDGSAPAEIVRTSEAIGAEVLVVSTHGRTGLSRLALGSVAERVIRSAACSVLTVRPRSNT